MPLLQPFQSVFRNEPFKALLFTLALSEISVLVANLDIVTSTSLRFFSSEQGIVGLCSDRFGVLPHVLSVRQLRLLSSNIAA